VWVSSRHDLGCRQSPLLQDQNSLQELPRELALLPALRKLYLAGTPAAQQELQRQQELQHGGGAAGAVAGSLIQQSNPFT
jgi:hypothetical protein